MAFVSSVIQTKDERVATTAGLIPGATLLRNTLLHDDDDDEIDHGIVSDKDGSNGEECCPDVF